MKCIDLRTARKHKPWPASGLSMPRFPWRVADFLIKFGRRQKCLMGLNESGDTLGLVPGPGLVGTSGNKRCRLSVYRHLTRSLVCEIVFYKFICLFTERAFVA